MQNRTELVPARVGDARRIAVMSRELIEHGLPWRWTPRRVERAIRDPSRVVLTARRAGRLVGFAIMSFGEELAHLELLAVMPSCQRQGIGTLLLEWLCESATTAGIVAICLEVRARSRRARAFYESLGYEEFGIIPGYYEGHEPAMRMVKVLRLNERMAERLLGQPSLAEILAAAGKPEPGA